MIYTECYALQIINIKCLLYIKTEALCIPTILTIINVIFMVLIYIISSRVCERRGMIDFAIVRVNNPVNCWIMTFSKQVNIAFWTHFLSQLAWELINEKAVYSQIDLRTTADFYEHVKSHKCSYMQIVWQMLIFLCYTKERKHLSLGIELHNEAYA